MHPAHAIVRSIITAAAAVAGCACAAQQHAFVQYTTRDGLSQSQVRCMAQDPRGYLWFGTLGGLSRFDGLVFSNHALQEGLPDPQVNALWADPAGLWLGAGDHLVRYDGNRFAAVALPGADHARVMAVTGDGMGRYVATDGAGVYRMKGNGISRLDGYPADTADGARALLLDREGRLYVGLRNGLLQCADGTCVAVDLGDARPKSVSALALDGRGTLWVGTFGDGLFEVSGGRTVRNITEEEGLLQNNIRCLLLDGQGRLWVGSKFGLNRIEGTRIRAFTVHQGLPNDNIWCGMTDRDGQLWFGTDGAGVLRYTGDRFVTFTTADGLCSDQVMSITADAAGDLWLGTYGNGVCRLDAMAMITTLDGLPNNTIWCGLRDPERGLWFGTSDGLCRIANGVVLPLPDGVPLKDERVLSLHLASDGTLWCGTREGLHARTAAGAIITHAAGPGGPGRSIRSIVPDDRGGLWLATDEGITRFDGGRFSRIDITEGLSDNTVFCLLRDERGRLWAGTANGLSCLENGRPRIMRLGQDFGSNYIDLLLAGDDGRIWAGTNNGLFAFNPDSLLADPSNAQHYDLADGLRDLEFNLNAAWKDPSGKLYFGTAGGLLVHDPARSAEARPDRPPVVHITGLRSFLRPMDWSAVSDSLQPITGSPIGLRLPFRRNHLTFDYAAIQTTHPERVRYRYRLVGSDQDPMPPTTDRSATYGNLVQGAYTFEVMASDDGRHWGPPATFSFTIEKPFWARTWFHLAMVLALAGTALAVHRFRRQRRARREKTRQLMLRSRMLQLEQQALNANMNRHFVFNALNSIQYYINRQDRDAANRYLTSFARLIRRNLDASQGDTTTLAEEIERLEIYLELEHMRFKDRFQYHIAVDPSVQAARVRIPAMMLQPYVENSIWHGILPMDRPGTVLIDIRMEGDRIRVLIEDDGIGIEASRQGKIGTSGDHISRGIEITKGRTDVLRRLHLADIRIDGPEPATAADGTRRGTRVVVDLPGGNGSERDEGTLRTATPDTTFGGS